MERETIIISLGGSVIVPDKIRTEWLTQLKELLLSYVDRYQFVIVCGGGQTARNYQAALPDASQEAKDWIGIQATRLNGLLIRHLFGDHAYPELLVANQRIETDKEVVVAAGWEPGYNTDYVSAILAETFQAKQLINISNITYVYDKDPKEHTDATPLPELSWKEFRALLPETWIPGLHAPFDPSGAKKAEALGLTAYFISGADLEPLAAVLQGKSFTGTRVQ